MTPSSSARQPRRLLRLPFAQVADAVALALLAAAAWVLVWGGSRFWIGPARVSLTSAPRLFVEAAIVILLRHLLVSYREIGFMRRIPWRRLVPRSPSFRPVAPAWITTRLIVLAVGYLAVVTIGYPPGRVPFRIAANELWNLPARWDTGWYLDVAENGYGWSPGVRGRQNVAFFPALPFVMRAGRLISLDRALLVWTGVAASLVACFWALAYLYRFVQERFGAEPALAAATLLAAYPFAVFYSAAYTESLFLLGTVGAFYHLERREVVRAGAWGLLVGLCRPNGGLLSLPLALIAARGWPGLLRSPDAAWLRTAGPALAAAAMPVAGLLAYSFFTFHLTGDPFAWVGLHGLWGRGLDTGSHSRYAFLQSLSERGVLAFLGRGPADTLNGLAALFVLATIWPVTRRLGGAYGLFVAVNALVPLLFFGLVSMGRYTAVLFPSFIWLALVIPARHHPILVAAFAMGQALIASLFFTWRLVF